MTFKKWLKKLALFPLSIIMGIPDGDTAAPAADTAGPSLNERIMAFAGAPEAQFMPVATQDAAASQDVAADADQQGTQGEAAENSNGLDTTADDAGLDADQDEEEDGEADETDQKENEDKGTKKRTLEERAAEIAEKIVNQKLAERDKAREQEAPDFVPDINEEKVNEYIATVEAKIDELRLEGKYGEARKLSRDLDKLDKDLEENEQRRVSWEAKQKSKQASLDSGTAARRELDQAAELYRAEMKIEPDTWNKMGEWFTQQLNAKPLIGAEFNDIYARSGKVAAIRFAHDYTVKNMGQQAKASTQKKEQAKTTTAALTAQTTGKAAPIDLKKAHAEFAANPTDEAYVKLQALKRAAKG